MDAHNDRDMETIKSLLSEDLVIWHSDGSIVEGRDAHLEALQSWFDETGASHPKASNASISIFFFICLFLIS